MARLLMWAHRAWSERAMAGLYRALAAAARATPFASFADRLAEAAGDELRHAALCASLAPAPWQAPAPPLDPVDDILIAIAITCCVGETLNVALLQHELRELPRDRADERAVTRALLADEMRHAQLGWDVLAAAAGRGSVAHLGPPLSAALAEAAARDGDALAALEPGQRAALLSAALDELVVPGLARHGVVLY